MNTNSAFALKPFKSADPRHPVDLYITASLDLANLTSGTYYFNVKNNFDYIKTKSRNTLIPIDDETIISEVVVYADNAIQTQPEEKVMIKIGGSLGPEEYTNNPVAVPWAGSSGLTPATPPYWSWSPLSTEEINKGVVNYFGHEGGHFPYYYDLKGDPDNSDLYRYLAMDLYVENQPFVRKPLDIETRRNILRQRRMRQYMPQEEPLFLSGKITVTLKLYPKFQ